MARPSKFAHVVYSTRRFERSGVPEQQLLVMPEGSASAIPREHGMS